MARQKMLFAMGTKHRPFGSTERKKIANKLRSLKKTSAGKITARGIRENLRFLKARKSRIRKHTSFGVRDRPKGPTSPRKSAANVIRNQKTLLRMRAGLKA